MRTKLGISVGLLGAATYLAAYFGGYVPAILLAGYVLLVEDNEWLRRTVVKAVALLISFAFLQALIGFIPSILSWIYTLVDIFDGKFEYETVTSIITLITKAIEIVKTCLFLILGAKALNQGTVTVPFVDGIVNKYF